MMFQPPPAQRCVLWKGDSSTQIGHVPHHCSPQTLDAVDYDLYSSESRRLEIYEERQLQDLVKNPRAALDPAAVTTYRHVFVQSRLDTSFVCAIDVF